MYEVNRSVFLLIPLEPFWAWLEDLPDINLDNLTLDMLQQDANAYLIPSCEDGDELWAEIEGRYLDIFAAELADWCEDEDLWPQLTLDRFKSWFKVKFSMIVTDLTAEELVREEFVPFELN